MLFNMHQFQLKSFQKNVLSQAIKTLRCSTPSYMKELMDRYKSGLAKPIALSLDPFITSQRNYHAKSKFAAFSEYEESFNSDNFDFKKLANSDYVFMRWKEHFLVPDHTIKDINGASFAGFYYICFTKSTGRVEGYYYHRSSELYQSIELEHISENSSDVYEFR
ncbi:glucose-induced degradation protein 4 homolog isoform X2 [Bactrocera tryoni]|uniref:glucose-induced degradation protein 4 homolog isoform X2 n=1 Tax=Bactrocera tryoni TaxID=59916 RepID=UPI001A98CB94|nr:glucose-induced degradation protein 4 homolog isoform X2 [Bactrocera tryoni]